MYFACKQILRKPSLRKTCEKLTEIYCSRLLPNRSLGAWGSYYLSSGNQNFKQGALTGALKLWFSVYKFQWTNNKILCSFCTFEITTKNIWSSAKCKKIFLPIEVKQTALCLEIRFCDFSCRAVEVYRLKMALNEFISFRKTFDNKIMTFPSALEMLGHYCMK